MYNFNDDKYLMIRVYSLTFDDNIIFLTNCHQNIIIIIEYNKHNII